MLNLNHFMWEENHFVLMHENSYVSQLFGEKMREKGLIDNDTSEYQGRRIHFCIPRTNTIDQLIEFLKEYDAFDWNMKCYEETNSNS